MKKSRKAKKTETDFDFSVKQLRRIICQNLGWTIGNEALGYVKRIVKSHRKCENAAWAAAEGLPTR